MTAKSDSPPPSPPPLQDFCLQIPCHSSHKQLPVVTIYQVCSTQAHTFGHTHYDGNQVNPFLQDIKRKRHPTYVLHTPVGAFLASSPSHTQRPSPPAFPLTSPALLLVVLADDAALGVGERCSVTRAMVSELQERRGEEKGGEGRRSAYPGRCAAEIVAVTGEKMPSQTLIQQQHLTPLPRPCSLSVLLRASSAVTGVLMGGK